MFVCVCTDRMHVLVTVIAPEHLTQHVYIHADTPYMHACTVLQSDAIECNSTTYAYVYTCIHTCAQMLFVGTCMYREARTQHDEVPANVGM